MSAQLLICIDGTASREPDYAGGEFDDLMICATNESNTRKFHRTATLPDQCKYYANGPDRKITGWDAGRIFDAAWRWLVAWLEREPHAAIHLVGHSRGGHIVTEIAIRLKRHHLGDFQRTIGAPPAYMTLPPQPGAAGFHEIKTMRAIQPVRFMGLFDAVDMTTSLGNTSSVPSNVQICHHAIRSRRVGSRRAWGNTAATAEVGVNFQIREFDATHGALGGAFPRDCEDGINRVVGFSAAGGMWVAGPMGGIIASYAAANAASNCALPVSAEQNAQIGAEAFQFVKNGGESAGLRFH